MKVKYFEVSTDQLNRVLKEKNIGAKDIISINMLGYSSHGVGVHHIGVWYRANA